MMYRLACELNDRIAAVVSVSGAMAEDIPCNSGRPVPLMEIHGTADSIVPYGGVPFFMKSIPDAIDFWVKRNQCSDDPAVTIFPDTDTTDGTTVVLKKYGNCQAAAAVWLMNVVDGGHVWPSQALPPPPFIGLTNNDVHGSSEIWNFLRQHSHPDPVRTQFPWHNPPALYAGFPDNLPFGSILQFADIDNDDMTEAFVLVAGGTDVKYYENPGNDSAPQFQFVQSFPFGMPNITGIAPFRYVDIDGDCDVDVFAAILPALGNGLAFIENKGTPEQPWFGNSTPEIQPFGITLPSSDSVPGVLPVNNFFHFVDIDSDNDFDLFLGGRFVTAGKKVHDENFYYYRNDDPSGEGTAPQFTGPFKNPFNLPRPLIADGAIATNFVDMDCDGDWDLFVIYPGAAVSYFENTGSPTAPDFGKAPTTWLANDPPAPPGFDGYFFGDWLDIGGDGDWDLVQPGTWLENISDGTMACRGNIPQFEECIIIDAVNHPASGPALNLFPNPARETIHCSFQVNKSPEEIEIGLFDWTGKRVKQFRVRPDGQTWQREISLSGLADGIYLFTLRSYGISVVRKFVKTGH
ncbi:MAG: T9SS type A sorting domain-containing protein [Thermoanaerobaculia bacterium]|nr:T9SS type A sorting domain-containing protein [Thermoanaerobaculia bacterium]